jgi:hypothetical protein
MSWVRGGRLFDARLTRRRRVADDPVMNVHQLPTTLRARLAQRVIEDVIEGSALDSHSAQRNLSHGYVIADLMLPVIADAVEHLRVPVLDTDPPDDAAKLERWNAALENVLAVLAER